MKLPQDTLTIDPVAMNVVNRVAAGSRLAGDLLFEGGLLVQGEISGQIRVNGRLIIWKGGVVRGSVRVQGDLYLFGQLGLPDGAAQDTQLECHGMAYVAQTGMSTGTLMAKRLQLYEGADLRGPFKTLKLGSTVPVLHDAQPQQPLRAPGSRS
ncbi:bactofilin family protein [Hydrogenophaga pseudoflava]|uniref:bactofilin family protein n=1 Tax=Hydrogenophaga pseudoflava TaxID=47421 RepID=UPI0027E4EFAE|nr:polymer-forming cytoskeletal protein [Hydrogenophaga pseudoflava]MDQ7744338.1 polymer-forming cytoskeletal protein [Hydrogenophaga pseudoflava]